MKLSRGNLAIVTSVLMITLATSSCKKDHAPVAGPAIKLTSNAKFGSILTDESERTLYFFSIDADGNSGCTGGCITSWPVFYEESPSIGTGLDAADFATITRTDGVKQTTYKGWPLYYFQNDAKPGDVNGDAVNKIWFVAKPDYSVMLANTQLVGFDNVKYNSHAQPGDEVTQYITDPYGKTLYSFSPDKFRKNTFTKADFSNNKVWPLDSAALVKNIPSTLDKTQFAIVTVFGKTQLCYKGWPLYYFGSDLSRRGNTKGVSFPSPGIWPIINLNSLDAPQ